MCLALIGCCFHGLWCTHSAIDNSCSKAGVLSKEHVNLIVASCIFVESLQFIHQRMHILFHIKHFKTLQHVSILSDHHQGALFLAKVILRYSQFNSYLQTSCCGSISCCVVEQWLGVHRIRRTPSHCSTTEHDMVPQHLVCKYKLNC